MGLAFACARRARPAGGAGKASRQLAEANLPLCASGCGLFWRETLSGSYESAAHSLQIQEIANSRRSDMGMGVISSSI